ncbi:MAG: phosphoribosylamine--glycine ligase [Alphaproteobacteria bacterium]|nr:phosphoribosylamine--glycine ligase [Alphaproteobacteria bacterium]
MSGQAVILLLGGGGREHALAWKMAQSPDVAAIYALPGNDGMAAIAKVKCIPGDPASVSQVLAAAEELKPALTVIGPEKPLAAGVSDALAEKGFAVFGPSSAAARLENSKIFAKEFMTRHGIPTAGFTICEGIEAARAALSGWNVEAEGVVIKADGLAAGKGVVVTDERNMAETTLHDFMANPECSVKADKVLLEKKLSGKEVSAFALCDGEKFVTLGYVCDYKRVRDDDQGPNTGGMGGYAPQDWPSESARNFVDENIFARVVAGMKEEGAPFKGILFAGLMVEGDAVSVIEFNTRFGDPETQILMPLIEGDIVPLLSRAASGALADEDKVTLKKECAVHVVMASEGYPETHGTGMTLGQKIELPEGLLQRGANDNEMLFVMGARNRDGQWTNEGGRVLGVTALGASMEEARRRAYSAIDAITFRGAHWRRDIGQ